MFVFVEEPCPPRRIDGRSDVIHGLAIRGSAREPHGQRTNLELTLAYDTTLEGWAHALELLDHETQGHAQRVTELTLQLARELELSDEALVNIREVIDMCIDEEKEKVSEINRFIGFREMQVSISPRAI